MKGKTLPVLAWAWLQLIAPPIAADELGLQGPGDVRDGYERADYETDSASLQSRRGIETDLLAVLSKYIVLTRHPLAVLSSYANSFFEGDYAAAVAFADEYGAVSPAMETAIGSLSTIPVDIDPSFPFANDE